MHLAYLGILAACVIGTLPLELWIGARVYRRWRRLLVALVPVVVVFGGWDILAIRADWWDYDPRLTTGIVLPGPLPLEELLFFVVIPICAVLTLEAVRVRRPQWLVGDEDGAR